MAVLIATQRIDPAKARPRIFRNGVPDAGEFLQCVRHQPIVGIKAGEELAARGVEREIMRDMLAAVILAQIAHGKLGGFDPAFDHLRGAVRRAVVDHNPFEIAQRLCRQTVEAAVQRMGAVVGRRENRKQRRAKERVMGRITRARAIDRVGGFNGCRHSGATKQ